jgi:predicted secreted protein
MAEGLVKDFPAVVRPVLTFCLENDINIIQMPCPETLSDAGGLGRAPKGKAWYEANGLRDSARKIAQSQTSYMLKLREQGFSILAIIGVDFSPACAVNYLNKGRSIVRGKGIYVEELEACMKERNIVVPFLGIRQAWKNKMMNDLRQLLSA